MKTVVTSLNWTEAQSHTHNGEAVEHRSNLKMIECVKEREREQSAFERERERERERESERERELRLWLKVSSCDDSNYNISCHVIVITFFV